MLQPSPAKTNRKALLAVIGLVVVLAGYTLTRGADSKTPAVGAAAPDFTLASQEGTPISLHDFKGKWVVLYFYPKDMTQGCTIEAHGFQRDLAQYDLKNAVVLGVSVDTVESHKEFCAKDSLTFKLLADDSKEVTGKYGSVMDMKGMTLAARNTFVIDPKGVIRKVYLKVNPTPHSAEVLAAL